MMCCNRTMNTVILSVLICGFTVRGAESQKLGPYLKRKLADPSLCLEKSNSSMLDLRIVTSNPSALIGDFTIRSVNGPYVTAYVEPHRIYELAANMHVQSIRLAQPCFLKLDQSLPEIGMDRVHNGSLGLAYTGKNVLIGIVDTGIDWSHKDFIDANGQSRILAIWDQTQDTYDGNKHVYFQMEIQQALDSRNYGLIGGKDYNGHGTHVSGIAAGNGRASGNGKASGRYIGVAPDASLIIVKVSDGISTTDSQIEAAVDFIFDYADQLGMPCVINLSLGRRNGSHDGRDDFELALNNYLWDPGHALVVAAGNDGGRRIHVQHEFYPFASDTLNVEIEISENPPQQTDQVSFEGWIHRFSSMQITIVNPEGEYFGPVLPGYTVQWPDDYPKIFVDNGSVPPNEHNGDKQVLIQLTDKNAEETISPGKWVFKFHNGSDQLDLWLTSQTLSAEITSAVNFSTLLNEPAHTLLAIAVGSYISRDQWPSLGVTPFSPENLNIGELSLISSPGPSRKNALNTQAENKPEISAPGEYILSAHSSWTTPWPGDSYVADDSCHRAWTGTSFAAPHVTGIIACMFEKDPDLTASFVKLYLIQSARHDQFTGNEPWNAYYGFGKVDGYSALSTTGIRQKAVHDNQTEAFEINNYPNPFNAQTKFYIKLGDRSSTGAKLEIWDISGRLVRDLEISDAVGTVQLSWDGRDNNGIRLPSGLYIARLKSNFVILIKKLTLVY
jgi:minor extracellular serine protease Vpr